MELKRMMEMEKEIAQIKQEVRSLRLWIWVGIGTNVILFIFKMWMPHAPQAPTSVHGNSVQIGTGPTVAPQRDYLTTEEVAAREGVAARTVTEWAREGKFTPEPVKGERAWQFAADYRVLPQEVVSGK